MFARWVILLLFLALAGCMTRYKKANELAKEGKFVEAAELFELLVKEDPTNKELPELLKRARYRAIEHALGRARRHRLAEDPSASQQHFAQGLELRRRWNVRLSGALEQTIDDERDDATRRLRALTGPHVQKGEALAAQHIIERHNFLLKYPELAVLRSELTAAAEQSGRGTCAKLVPTAKRGEPYWTWAVAQYCKHFQAPGPQTTRLPDTFSAVRQASAVAAMDAGVAGRLDEVLLARLREGPWYTPDGLLSATLSTRGAAPVSERQTRVRLSAPWVERVPYVEHVRTTLSEKVPVTECESYEDYVAGAPGGKVTRSREVVREKVREREVVVPETRFRDVPRTFEYEAIRVERTTKFSAQVELVVADQVVATSGRDTEDTLHGYAHDAVFEPARVKPSRPSFPPAQGWFDKAAAQLADAFTSAMRGGWRSRFCSAAAYSPEEAARCARAVADVPKEALDALTPILGSDARHIPELLGAPK